MYVNRMAFYMVIIGGSRGGPGRHVPPLEHFKWSVLFELFFCWCTCLAKLAYRFTNIAGDERMCGKYLSRASEWGRFLEMRYGKFLLLPPPPTPLNREGFWRSRKISATTPPPQSVVVPLLDYPLRIRPW